MKISELNVDLALSFDL